MHIEPGSRPSSQNQQHTAATKIQAGFRGYRVRKQLKKYSNQNGNIINQDESVLADDPDLIGNADFSDKDKSATRIQATVRGFLVRKQQKAIADAATKIQATFRGFKVRTQLHKFKENLC